MTLSNEQAAYLGDAMDDPAEIASRCVALLEEHGYTAAAAWTDPKLTSSSGQHCLQITIGEARHYGHGETEGLAALECFAHLWFEFVTVPAAPAPSVDELLMRDSGKPLGSHSVVYGSDRRNAQDGTFKTQDLKSATTQ